MLVDGLRYVQAVTAAELRLVHHSELRDGTALDRIFVERVKPLAMRLALKPPAQDAGAATEVK